MFAKIEISGTIEVISGLHIGASDAFAAIGAIDSPIVRDAYTDRPMIPGSSLKGKLRNLLARRYPNGIEKNANDDVEEILRLFGSSKKKAIRNSRLIFADMTMDNWEELKKRGVQSPTEAKFENTINRMTAEANPRQIERVVRGATFPLQIIYNAEDETQIVDDIRLLKEGMQLLTYDYLGGNGSRGYGKVRFTNLYAEVVIGEISDEIMEQCNAILVKE